MAGRRPMGCRLDRYLAGPGYGQPQRYGRIQGVLRAALRLARLLGQGTAGQPPPARKEDLMTGPAYTPMNDYEAREITVAIRTRAEETWDLVVLAFNRRADTALGYE